MSYSAGYLNVTGDAFFDTSGSNTSQLSTANMTVNGTLNVNNATLNSANVTGNITVGGTSLSGTQLTDLLSLLSPCVVLVNGWPETPYLWTSLIIELNKRGVTNIISIGLPGMGVPVPDGWTYTRQEYIDYLYERLVLINNEHGRVHLYGHDWGALISAAVVGLPSTIGFFKSFIMDCTSAFINLDGEFQELIEGPYADYVLDSIFNYGLENYTASFSPYGMSNDSAEVFYNYALDSSSSLLAMNDSIKTLIRDTDPNTSLTKIGENLADNSVQNILNLLASADPNPSGIDSSGVSLQVSLGKQITFIQQLHGEDAEYVVLDSLSHWYMNQNPILLAMVLISHWKASA